jgi:hypothetical protein
MAQSRIAAKLLAALLAISLGANAAGCVGGPHPTPPELTPTEGPKAHDAGAGDSESPPGAGYAGHASAAGAGGRSGSIGNGAGRGGGAGNAGAKSDSGVDCGAGISDNDAGTPCNPDEDSGTVAR